jgi:hypothetical protein
VRPIRVPGAAVERPLAVVGGDRAGDGVRDVVATVVRGVCSASLEKLYRPGRAGARNGMRPSAACSTAARSVETAVAPLISYQEFLRFQALQEQEALARFDRLVARMAEQWLLTWPPPVRNWMPDAGRHRQRGSGPADPAPVCMTAYLPRHLQLGIFAAPVATGSISRNARRLYSINPAA